MKSSLNRPTTRNPTPNEGNVDAITAANVNNSSSATTAALTSTFVSLDTGVLVVGGTAVTIAGGTP